MKQRILDLKLQLFIDICSEFDGHLGFPHFVIVDVFLMCLTELLILDYLCHQFHEAEVTTIYRYLPV